MTTDGLPVTYRGEREGEAEMRYLSICLNENGQLPATQVHSQPSVKKITKSGRHLYRPSAAEQLSGISPIQKLPWRPDRAKSEASNAEKTLASFFIIGFVPASTLVLLTEKLFFAVVSARSVGHKPTKKFSESFFTLMYRYKIWLALFCLGLLAYLWAQVYLVKCFTQILLGPILSVLSVNSVDFQGPYSDLRARATQGP